jgi:hypothetical protein
VLIPLSTVQQSAVPFICEGGHSSFGLNVSLSLRLRGPLSKPALERALGYVMTRHEGLRSRVHHVEGQWLQSFAPSAEAFQLDTVAVSCLPDAEARIARRLSSRLDLERGGPLHVELLQLSEHDHVLLFIISHTATDTHADDLFIAELLTAYACHVGGAPPPFPPAMTLSEHVAAEIQAGSVLGDAQLQYWADVIGNATPAIPGRECQRGVGVQNRGRIIAMPMTARATHGLEDFAAASKVSLMAVLCAIMVLAVYRQYGVADVSAFMTHAGRDSRQLKTLGASTGRDFLIRVALAKATSLTHLAKLVQSALIRSAIASRLPFTHERAVAQLPRPDARMHAAATSSNAISRGHLHITDALQIKRSLPDLTPGLDVERVMPGPLLQDDFHFEPARGETGARDAPYAGVLNVLLRRDLSSEPGTPITLVGVFLEDSFDKGVVRRFLASVCRVAELAGDDNFSSLPPIECRKESKGRA